MHSVGAEHIGEVAELCRSHHVERFNPFGSGASGEFDLPTSDLDSTLAHRRCADPVTWSNSHLGLRAAFDRTLDRLVNLKIQQPSRSPSFDEAIEETRIPLFAPEGLHVQVVPWPISPQHPGGSGTHLLGHQRTSRWFR